MQILMPVSGLSLLFPKEDSPSPTPLIDRAEKPMVEFVVSQLKHQFGEARFIFVVDRNEARSFSLDQTLKLLAGPNSQVIERLGRTSGPLCSCLLACDTLEPSSPLLIPSSDQITTDDLRGHIKAFQRQEASAGVVTFDSVRPGWPYVIADGDPSILEASDRGAISRDTMSGVYYFNSAHLFIQSAQRAMINSAPPNGLYSLQAALNEVVLAGEKVLHTSAKDRCVYSVDSPSMITDHQESMEQRQIDSQPVSLDSTIVIIAAAGEGRRFADAGWKKPKPFIDVNGRPMLAHVIDNLKPVGSSTWLLMRAAHLQSHLEAIQRLECLGVQVTPIAELTEGTACTVLQAREVIDNNRPLLIANSDQMINYDLSTFVQDCLERALDGSILVFRDPAMDRKWSFAKIDDAGYVTKVAEKDPISDLATAGIYLFSKGSDFVSAAADMITANDRVNGEFYTCPVYNYMIRNGARIGVYEIPFKSMIGLGTPEDLTSYLTSIGAPVSVDAPR